MARVRVDDYRLVGIFARQRQVIFVPSLPRIFFTASLTVMPRVETLSIFTMKSPLSPPPVPQACPQSAKPLWQIRLPADFHPKPPNSRWWLLYLSITFFIHIFEYLADPISHHTASLCAFSYVLLGIGFVLIVVCLGLTVNLRHCADGLHRQDFVIPPVASRRQNPAPPV